MAQFAGRGGAGWVWVVVVLLVIILAVLVYLAVVEPAVFEGLGLQV